ncbi:MAG TPA: FAD-dependent oxidoreductase [Candidatus Paceibacterota bacterium]|jgi:protoporphyrinogen oxidase|nr:FAD-dependent oxidoreductase [Candidatus Paceibacterota bacterium]
METFDYIIVGSGIAGIHTAYRLNQQGKKVLVLEKESYVGGRMSTRLVHGHPVDYGAKFVTKFYTNMMNLAKELNVDFVPIPVGRASIKRDGKLYSFESKTKALLSYKGLSLWSKVRLALGTFYLLVRYRNLDFHRLETTLHLDNKNLYDDMRNIVGPEAFDYLIEAINQDVIFHSTKEASRAPFYTYIPKLLKIKGFSFPGGIGDLCKKMATFVPVQLNTEVRSVERRPGGVQIKTIHNGKEIIYKAKRAIIAVPGSRVLDIFTDPLPEEKAFFSSVRYAGTVQIIGTTKTDLISETGSIWTIPKNNPAFAAISFKQWNFSFSEEVVFYAALKGDTYWYLRRTGTFNHAHLQDLLQKDFPRLHDVKVLDVQIWESATPILYPGYVTRAINFRNRPNWDNRIYFCGDYLENPSTEGALTSSIKLLQKINGTSLKN